MRLIGPNCPGVLSPARPTSGSSPRSSSTRGTIGVVSKSGTLTYQIGNELKQAGLGNSTIVGIGGDPIVGSDFIDILTLFEDDDETELIVMVGEIGGDAEERAAEFIAETVSKPVVAYIAGFTAPPGKQMGHAGAIISGSSGPPRRRRRPWRPRASGSARARPRRPSSPSRRWRDRPSAPARAALRRGRRARALRGAARCWWSESAAGVRKVYGCRPRPFAAATCSAGARSREAVSRSAHRSRPPERCEALPNLLAALNRFLRGG